MTSAKVCLIFLQLLIVTFHCICGLTLPIPDIIYITTQSSIDEQQSEISTDLVAPEASSLSQYYQPQNYPQQDFFQQPSAHHVSPFLYTGPLILMESHGEKFQQSEPKNIEKDSANHEQNSYVLYRPTPQDNPEFADMLPPSQHQNEPNYYAIKPRKNKKFSKTDSDEKKTVKKKEIKQKIIFNQNKDLVQEPSIQLNTDEIKISAKLKNETENIRKERDLKNESDESNESSEDDYVKSVPSSRLDFQMHGKY